MLAQDEFLKKHTYMYSLMNRQLLQVKLLQVLFKTMIEALLLEDGHMVKAWYSVKCL